MELIDGSEYTDHVFELLDCSERSLSDIEFEGVEFISCNFQSTVLKNIRFIDCTFKNCDVSLWKATQSQFLDVEFIGCRAMGINWALIKSNLGISIEFRESVINDSVFDEVDFRKSRLDHCEIKRCVFSHSDLREVDFKYSDLEKTIFQQTDLRKADFRHAKNYFIDITDPGIKLTKAQFSQIEAQNLLASLDIIIE